MLSLLSRSPPQSLLVMPRDPTITNWESLTETILFRHAPFDGVSDSFDVDRCLDEFMPSCWETRCGEQRDRRDVRHAPFDV